MGGATLAAGGSSPAVEHTGYSDWLAQLLRTTIDYETTSPRLRDVNDLGGKERSIGEALSLATEEAADAVYKRLQEGVRRAL